jgi:hypothetical protein
MQKYFIIIVLLSFVINSNAQNRRGTFSKDPILNNENFDKQKMYFGFYLGFNSYDFKVDYKKLPEIQVESTLGFSVGVVADLRLSEYFNLRFEPGYYVAQRNLTFTNPAFTQQRDYLREVKSAYINFPFLLKYSALRTGNVRPYLIGGVSTSLNLSSNSGADDDNSQQVFRMKSWTNNYELGFGVDLYLEYFKFSPSIRGVFGMDDELIRDADPNSPWTGNIESLKTRGIFVNFCFH